MPQETPETPVETKPAAVAEAVPVVPKITIDASEYASIYQSKTDLERRLAAFESEKNSAIEAAQKAHIEELARTKGAAAAIEERERQLLEKYDAQVKEANTLKESWRNEKRDNVLNAAIGAAVFVSKDAREDAIAKLRSRVVVESGEGNSVRVRDSVTGRFAEEAVPELLKSPEFAHYLAPTSRGGAGASGGDRPGDSGTAVDSLKAFGQQYQNQQQSSDRYAARGLHSIS